MTRDKIVFGQLSQTSELSLHIRGLVLDMREKFGDKAFLDLTNCSGFNELARDVISAFGQHALFNFESEKSFQNYKRIAREVIAFAEAKKLRKGFCLAEFDTELLLALKVHIEGRSKVKKNATRRRLYGNFLRLLQAARGLGLFSTDVIVPRNFRHVRDSRISQPYTLAEQLDLEAACRACIEATLTRLERGRELTAQGINPRGVMNGAGSAPEDRVWNKLENLLWYAQNVHGGAPLQRSDLKALKDYSFINAVCGVYGGALRLKDVRVHQYVTCEDLIPIFILLAKRTGRNECSLLTLTRSCLVKDGYKYFLLYTKPRSGTQVFRRKIADDGEWSAVKLIQLLQQLTEPLVQWAPEGDKQSLFLGLTVRATQGNPIKALDPSYFKSQMNRKGGWCERQEIMDVKGKVLKISAIRLRTTYLSLKYVKHGQLAKVSSDAAHAIADTSVGYVANEATKHLHHQAVRAGQRSVVALATKPTVLDTMNVAVVSEKLELSPETARRMLRGEMDVLFNACKDIMNRPGGAPNTQCQKPWQCFGCGNSVITRHTLPRVIAFQQHADRMRLKLPLHDWNAMFGAQMKFIREDVLPRFSERVIQRAITQVEDLIFYIPMELGGHAS